MNLDQNDKARETSVDLLDCAVTMRHGHRSVLRDRNVRLSELGPTIAAMEFATSHGSDLGRMDVRPLRYSYIVLLDQQVIFLGGCLYNWLRVFLKHALKNPRLPVNTSMRALEARISV